MKYIVHPRIAALVKVVSEVFPERYGERACNYIFLSPEAGIEKGLGDPVEFEDLPLEVRAAINKHFGTVFALPIGKRSDYLASLQPWEIEA